MNPFYGCCKFRGSLMSLDALTGKTSWRTHVIDQEPGRHYIFVEEWGPSGAPVWSGSGFWRTAHVQPPQTRQSCKAWHDIVVSTPGQRRLSAYPDGAAAAEAAGETTTEADSSLIPDSAVSPIGWNF
jgi:hypothetical protein